MQNKNQKIRFSCASDVGRVREVNQDNFICNGIYMSLNQKNKRFSLSGETDSSNIHLFGVFDGMGGEECGEVAAFLAAKDAAAFRQDHNTEQALKILCLQTNHKICQYAEEHEIMSMGTTAAFLAFSVDQVVLCNIGDSRILRFDGANLKQISVDHITRPPAGQKPLLSQNLGIPDDVMIIEPYIKTLECQREDVFIICSDGLTNMVDIADLWKIIRETDVEDLAYRLVEKALKNGGKDNVTVIALKKEEGIQ